MGKGLNKPYIRLAELIKYGRTLEGTTVQGEAMAGSSVDKGDGKVHKMYTKPQTRQHNQASDVDTKVKHSRGATLGMITRQAAVMAHLDSAGVATSARNSVLAATRAIVVVAQGIYEGEAVSSMRKKILQMRKSFRKCMSCSK